MPELSKASATPVAGRKVTDVKIAMVSERFCEVAELVAALRRRGHEVVAHAPDDPGSLPHLGDFAAALRAEWHVAPPDVVHTHFWTSGLAGALATHRLGIPIVHSCRGLAPAPDSGCASDRLDIERLLTREVAHMIADCPREAFALTTMGVTRRNISVIPPGVDTNAFTPDGPQDRRALPHRIVAVDEPLPHSGFREIVIALSAVDDAELVIASHATGEDRADEDEVAHLRALARECDVSSRVLFAARVSRSALPRLLRSADVVLGVPWHERSDTAVLEAMACGVAVITTPVGGLVDAVVDGVTGRHVPPRHPRALARVLRSMLTDDTTRYAFGIAARDRVCSRYTWDRVAADTVRAYERAGVTASKVVRTPADLN